MSMAEVCCETVAAVGRGEAEKRAMGEARRRRRAGEVRRWKVAAVGEEAASLKRRFGGSEEGLVESRHGVASVAGRRREMEDAVSVRAAFAASPARGVGTEGEGYDFYGVFDGHGCSHVAEACRDRMHEVVAEELSAVELPSWGAVMERSFSRMDAEVMAGVSRGEGSKCRCEAPKCDHVGSTAVVAVVGGRRIVVANCGDSRAVLCRNGLPVPLSSDHKPDRPDELERIQEAGGRVIFWEGARVLGVLAMSRAIGDGYLKPYVVAEPEVTVTEREDGDECLILASDGLWDVVSNEAACEVASACLRRRRRERGCADAAALLAKLALARRSSDNVSVVVVNLRRPTAL